MRKGHRITTDDVFERKEQIEMPKKAVFLSVEGNFTEVEYFEGISKYRKELGIDCSIIDVKVIKRAKNDTNSAPQAVLDLLEEYVEFRKEPSKQIKDMLEQNENKIYNLEFIDKYLKNPKALSVKEKEEFEEILQKIGYDIQYKKYLSKYNKDEDAFCIVIDRDKQSTKKRMLIEIIKHCKKNGYICYLTNPCFEFWLLLHLSDVKKEYVNEIDKILENKRISQNHTYVSKEISKKAGHGKKNICFEKNYLKNTDKALQRVKDFETELDDIINNIGSNIGDLINLLRE